MILDMHFKCCRELKVTTLIVSNSNTNQKCLTKNGSRNEHIHTQSMLFNSKDINGPKTKKTNYNSWSAVLFQYLTPNWMQKQTLSQNECEMRQRRRLRRQQQRAQFWIYHAFVNLFYSLSYQLCLTWLVCCCWFSFLHLFCCVIFFLVWVKLCWVIVVWSVLQNSQFARLHIRSFCSLIFLYHYGA